MGAMETMSSSDQETRRALVPRQASTAGALLHVLTGAFALASGILAVRLVVSAAGFQLSEGAEGLLLDDDGDFPGPFFWMAASCFGLLICVPLVFICHRAADRIASPERWRARYLNEGRCPNCRYDIRGLPEARCPECGETWGDDADG